jgi:putative ABC transport system ATP-binding protein
MFFSKIETGAPVHPKRNPQISSLQILYEVGLKLFQNMNDKLSLLEAINISKAYRLGKIKVRALRNVSLKIKSGEMLCIMGPSGSGKTTLLNLLGLLDQPTAGQIFLQGRLTRHLPYGEGAKFRSQFLGFIFQSFNLFPVLDAYENVEYPLIFFPLTKKERRERVLSALEDVQLSQVLDHRPDELSGGERQRVAIARALVTQPLLILADEPTANLDSKNAETIMTVMRHLNQARQTTFIFSTHDPRVTKYATRIVHLSDGVIQDDSGMETF